jgi:hypothetical protein
MTKIEYIYLWKTQFWKFAMKHDFLTHLKKYNTMFSFSILNGEKKIILLNR